MDIVGGNLGTKFTLACTDRIGSETQLFDGELTLVGEKLRS